jgi:O-antigen ligase
MRTLAFWLSLILIFVTAWEDMVFFEGLGTVSRAMGLLLAAFWIVKVIVTGRFRKPRPFHVMVYLFVLWNTVSAFWSFDVEETLQRSKTYFQLAGLVWILWDLYTSPTALKAGLQAYVLGVYVSIGSTVVNYVMGQEANYLRYAATGFNANDLGLMLALGIPVAWHLAVSESNSKVTHMLSLVNYAYIPIAILAISLTASRGALLAALPAFLFVLGSLPRLNFFLRVLIFAALISALFALQPLVPQSSFQRLGTTGASIADGDLGDRVDIWRESIASFTEHPLLGIGSGAFRTAVVPGNVAHNSFLSVLAEVGMVGFALFVIILAMTVYQAMHQPKWDARFWLIILLVWTIGASSLTWEHRKATWLFLSLVVVGASLSVRRDEARCAQSLHM